MDTYQPIYDAVRSRIGSVDAESAIRDAINFGHARDRIEEAFISTAHDMSSPSVLYRPTLAIDGNKWRAMYGENLQDGVAGFGESPAEAMADFDKAWRTALKSALPAPAPEGGGR